MKSERRAPRPPLDPSGIEEPHDILAAEQFAVPAPDARRPPADPTGIDEPHDVLAADQFAMPAPPERPPVDPSGIEEPHDVLAAEQFAVPAPDTAGSAGSGPPANAASSQRPRERGVTAIAAAVAAATFAALSLVRRARR